MITKHRLLGLTVGLAILLIPVAAIATSASALLNVRSPEAPRQAGETPPLAVPLVLPERGIKYQRHDPGTNVIRHDGRPVGQLRTAPADAPEIDAFLPDQVPVDTGRVSFAFLGSVRYGGQGKHLQISTIQPSAVAARQMLLLGDTTVRLPDGSAAWTTTDPSGSGASRVAFVRDGLILVVSGDFPLDQLLSLVTDVVVE